MPLGNIRAKRAGGVISNSLRAGAAGTAGVSIASVGAALLIGLISLPKANAQSISDTMPLSYSAAEIFAKALRDNTAALNETNWSDFSALGYAKSARTGTVANRWLPPPLPAVDGFNAKVDGYGGGASHARGLYGGDGSLSIPLAQQWGLQIDGGVGSFNSSGTAGGAGHIFWRDPSVGLLGAYGSYSHWNGISVATLPRTGVNYGRYAAEGEYYAGRWTFRGLAGYETVRVNTPVVPAVLPLSVPNRFFDSISASNYVTDDFKLSIGHLYTIGRNALTLGSEYGFGLGGGRMAALFADGIIGEAGLYAARGGLRIYFGRHDKTLIDRNRQDDPQHQDVDVWDVSVFAKFIEANLVVPPATTTSGVTTPGTTTPGTTPAGTPTTSTGGGTSTCTLGPPTCPL